MTPEQQKQYAAMHGWAIGKIEEAFKVSKTTQHNFDYLGINWRVDIDHDEQEVTYIECNGEPLDVECGLYVLDKCREPIELAIALYDAAINRDPEGC